MQTVEAENDLLTDRSWIILNSMKIERSLGPVWFAVVVEFNNYMLFVVLF